MCEWPHHWTRGAVYVSSRQLAANVRLSPDHREGFAAACQSGTHTERRERANKSNAAHDSPQPCITSLCWYACACARRFGPVCPNAKIDPARTSKQNRGAVVTREVSPASTSAAAAACISILRFNLRPMLPSFPPPLCTAAAAAAAAAEAVCKINQL